MKPAKAEVQIIAGKLRRRRIQCLVQDTLRPTPMRVREAYFSIMGNAIPDRHFFDVFAGTGIHGLEAVSRGATEATFIEHDRYLVDSLNDNMRLLKIDQQGLVLKADVYRWVERWMAPQDAVNVFVSPPFPDLTNKKEEFIKLIAELMEKVAIDSTVTVQAEDNFDITELPGEEWDIRTYGRNVLAIWVKPDPNAPPDDVVEEEE